MAREGRTKVIYKGTFVSKQSLCSNGQIYGGEFAKFCSLLRLYELYLAAGIEYSVGKIHRIWTL